MIRDNCQSESFLCNTLARTLRGEI